MRRRDPLVARAHLGDDGQQLVAPGVADAVDARLGVEPVAGDDRPVQLEALLAVHDQRVVEPELGVHDQALGGREAHGDEERRRRDDVAVAERLRGRGVVVGRVLVADRRREAPDVAPRHLEGLARGGGAAQEVAVEGHRAVLSRRGRVCRGP